MTDLLILIGLVVGLLVISRLLLSKGGVPV